MAAVSSKGTNVITNAEFATFCRTHVIVNNTMN